MSNIKRRPSPGFTLIELLTVIAIIGILAAIIIPTLGSVLTTVKRKVDGTSLRTIGQAALNYASDSGDGYLPDPLAKSSKSISGSDNFRVWMGLLAKTGAMPDPKLYFSKVDLTFPTGPDLPSSVLNPDNKAQIASDFAAMTPAFEFVGGLRTSDNGTCPIGYTRGLKADGTWDATKGPYADWGGHIVFISGSEVTFTGAIDNKLTNMKGKSTNNIQECVPFAQNGHQEFYGINAVIGSPQGTAPVQAK